MKSNLVKQRGIPVLLIKKSTVIVPINENDTLYKLGDSSGYETALQG